MVKKNILNKYFVGVDGGGTKTKLAVMDENGQVIAHGIAGMGNINISTTETWKSFEQALLQCLTWEQINASEIHVFFGCAGTESLKSIELFRQQKPDYIFDYELVSDAHIACIGAHAGMSGAIISVGTGVVGYQIESGYTVRVGGWGFPFGDEGGGAWMGMKAVRLTLKVYDGLLPSSLLSRKILSTYGDPYNLIKAIRTFTPTDYARFTPLVIECANNGDNYAIEFLSESGWHISQIADQLHKKQTESSRLPLVLMGGLAKFVTPYISQKTRQRLKTSAGDAVEGALFLLRNFFFN